MSPRGIFTHVGIILHILDCLGQDMRVLYLGRAPRTKETLLDFLKWCQVTRPPLVFSGLTGSQRTPGFWGITYRAWDVVISGRFLSYYHIPMHLPDAEKTTFITPHGLYCYNVMPFGLKNVEATYQRLVTRIFRPLIDITMEVYIDDMFVKTKERPDHTKNLQETFDLLCTNGMKLNPLKCAFRVSSGKFLGFMVT